MTSHGSLPGFEYSFQPPGSAFCLMCRRDALQILLPGILPAATHANAGLCEPCAMLCAWAWRSASSDLCPPVAYPTEPGFVLALLVRERDGDLRVPYDVLMVERKDEPGYYGLPGGKIEKGETPEAACVRELYEETMLKTVEAALEPVYTGYSPRTRLGRAYLVRGYFDNSSMPARGFDSRDEGGGGESLQVSIEGCDVSWKPWPPRQHANHLSGFYAGLEEAFNSRRKLHRVSAATTPLTLRLGEPAVNYLERKRRAVRGEGRADDARMMEGYSHVMTSDEKGVVDVIVETEIKLRDAEAVSAISEGEMQERVLASMTARSSAAPRSVSSEETLEFSADEDDENRVTEGERGASPSGFVRR